MQASSAAAQPLPLPLNRGSASSLSPASRPSRTSPCSPIMTTPLLGCHMQRQRRGPAISGYACEPMAADVWLIIPTYNEAANVERIFCAARVELERALPGGFRILIVDDNSPDGTGEIADRLAAGDEAVEGLHRPPKAGLGPAYLAGFAHAMASGAETLIEMDADFSHDPAYLPALIEASRTADLVLGSRYVPGGGVRDWGVVRQFISRGGGLYARWVL